MDRLLLLVIIMLFLGCTDSSSYEKPIEFEHDAGLVDFSQSVEGDWNRLCLFGPYSRNQEAIQLLGFPWNLEANSNVYLNDGTTLFVFSNDHEEVVTYFEVIRTVDFSTLGNQCFERDDSVFNISSGEVFHKTH